MNLAPRVRVVAAVGAVVAAGTTTVLALTAGSASADEPGRCTDNVNVREEPDAVAKIVALCEAGTRVALGEERDGFVRIDELGGWAAREFVTTDGGTPDGAAREAGEAGEGRGVDGDAGDPATVDGATHDSATGDGATGGATGGATHGATGGQERPRVRGNGLLNLFG